MIKNYSRFVSKHPYLIMLLVGMFSIFMILQLGNLRFENKGNKDMLPDGVEVIDEFTYISNEFDGTDSIQILVKLNPTVINSTQPRDIRDPQIMRYIDLLSTRLEQMDEITSTDNPAKTLKMLNNGTIPNTAQEIKEFTNYLAISDDYNSALIKANIDNAKGDELYNNLMQIIYTTPKPSRVEVKISGEIITDVVMEGLMGSDMGKTSKYALIGIFVVIIFIFRSLKYGLTPLSTILFANIWSFGMLGFLGMPITSVMTGVSSMIMGIGIDFGIQVVYRYKYEMKTKKPQKAMEDTLSNVIMPMSTTTLAALIGFRAMSLGELTMMADIGTMMTYGVLFSMIAALTFVPAILVIFENYGGKKISPKTN